MSRANAASESAFSVVVAVGMGTNGEDARGVSPRSRVRTWSAVMSVWHDASRETGLGRSPHVAQRDASSATAAAAAPRNGRANFPPEGDGRRRACSACLREGIRNGEEDERAGEEACEGHVSS